MLQFIFSGDNVANVTALFVHWCI